MAKEVKEVMDSGELAEYLGYTRRTIYKLIREEGLPATRIRGQFRFKKELVDRWLEERMSQQRGEGYGKE
ncbi:MAG: helix-turn-helix domain-containing protein [Candidatus Zixiibacteriota bacterium]